MFITSNQVILVKSVAVPIETEREKNDNYRGKFKTIEQERSCSFACWIHIHGGLSLHCATVKDAIMIAFHYIRKWRETERRQASQHLLSSFLCVVLCVV